MLCTPLCVQVRCSGRDKVDGVYKQMKDKNLDKPCYMNATQKKAMYLYWYNGKWRLGYELSSHKSFACAVDTSAYGSPCDPSLEWKVYDSTSKEYKVAPSDMQVCLLEPSNKSTTSKPEQYFLAGVPLNFQNKPEQNMSDVASKPNKKFDTEECEVSPPPPIERQGSTGVDFEKKLRAMLSAATDQEQMKLKLDAVKAKLNNHKPYWNASQLELANKITIRVGQEFGMGFADEDISAVTMVVPNKGMPSPKRPRVMPNQPMTPPKHQLPCKAP